MADQPFGKWHEINAKETSKKSTILKAAAILILFIVLLIANDFVYYRFLDNSSGFRNENRSSLSFNGEKSTRPEIPDLDRIRNETDQLRGEIRNETNQLRGEIKGIQKQVQSNFNEIKGIGQQVQEQFEKVQTNFSEIHYETGRIKSELQSDLSEVERQMSSTMLQHKSDMGKIRTEMSSDRKEFGNRLVGTESKMNDLGERQKGSAGRVEKLEKAIQRSTKDVENRQTEMFDKFKEQEKVIQSRLGAIENLENGQSEVSNRVEKLEKGLQNGLKGMENFENELTETSNKFKNMEKGIKRDMKAIENKQTEVSNKIKNQENELKRLRIDLSGDGRPGKYFFYKLSGVDKFFQLKKSVDSAIFTVKGIPFYLVLNGKYSKEKPNYLSIFLYKPQTIKSVTVRYEFSLINLHGKQDRVHTRTKTFEAAEDNWGREFFIKQKELTALGFIKDDTILLKAYVEVLKS